MKPGSAQVTSTEAIERFRTRLIIYRDKVKPLLADAADEVSRTREWLAQRQVAWEGELRRRRRELEEARAAHFGARFSNLREVRASEQAALREAEKAVAEAEEKLAAIKRWSLAFDQQAGPLLKQVEQLRTLAGSTVAHAEEHLARILQRLDTYAETRPETGLPPGGTP